MAAGDVTIRTSARLLNYTQDRSDTTTVAAFNTAATPIGQAIYALYSSDLSNIKSVHCNIFLEGTGDIGGSTRYYTTNTGGNAATPTTTATAIAVEPDERYFFAFDPSDLTHSTRVTGALAREWSKARRHNTSLW